MQHFLKTEYHVSKCVPWKWPDKEPCSATESYINPNKTVSSKLYSKLTICKITYEFQFQFLNMSFSEMSNSLLQCLHLQCLSYNTQSHYSNIIIHWQYYKKGWAKINDIPFNYIHDMEKFCIQSLCTVYNGNSSSCDYYKANHVQRMVHVHQNVSSLANGKGKGIAVASWHFIHKISYKICISNFHIKVECNNKLQICHSWPTNRTMINASPKSG